jgi:outer membrane receptor for ferrienterochelin and colicins
MRKFAILVGALALVHSVYGQMSGSGAISGRVHAGGEGLPFATVSVKNTDLGIYAAADGAFLLEDMPAGEWLLLIRMVGYREMEYPVSLRPGEVLEADIDMASHSWQLETVVITGSRSFQRRTDAPVIVQVLDRKTLESTQSNALSEGLCFQPGLRVESNCQTCSYSQLRMNGLGGAYSQILVNNRAIFGSLIGLYGLEQFPSQLIERVEVVRGGGSALYGSNAIGGTVNVITRRPERNAYELSAQYARINGRASDVWLQGTASAAGASGKSGLHVSVSRRDREAYDHNGDGFTELPLLVNTALNLQTFTELAPRHTLDVFLTHWEEERRGGDRLTGPVHLANQAEERDHGVFMGGWDYRWDWKEERGGLSFYGALQNVSRTHYTGILPDDPLEYLQHLQLPPYGDSRNRSGQIGCQASWRTLPAMGGRHLLTAGVEYLGESVQDRIEAYAYDIDQQTRNTGLFVQSEWKLPFPLTLQTGLRADRHNLVEDWLLNPRVSLLYQMSPNGQLRLSWGTGFRAPQAFDADLHIAFAGGGIQRIVLSDELREERSGSWSASLNLDRPGERQIYGFTLEGFYTRLKDAFILEERAGTGPSILEKRNGSGSFVAGATVELRWNYDQKVQWESGLTWQQSRFDETVAWSAEIPGTRDYLRTPDVYGYHVLTLSPGRLPLQLNWSGVLTGPMWAPHFGLAGDPGTPENDALKRTPAFWEHHIRLAYTLSPSRWGHGVEFFFGVQNVGNAYQQDFDSGKNRDSNYIYGPARPRTIFAGCRFRSK